jgi:hypothetical protein
MWSSISISDDAGRDKSGDATEPKHPYFLVDRSLTVTESNEPQKPAEAPTDHTKRDAETQKVLGIFITYISIPVLIGTYWAENARAMIVNATAGLVLLAIGVGMAVWGTKTSKRIL